MDFGLLGFDNFLCSTSASNNGGSFALENGAAEFDKQQKCHGFGFLKQERAINEDDLRDFKVAKTSSSSSICCGETMLKFPLQRSDGSTEGHQQMLSFSSPSSKPVTFPYYQHTSNAFGRNTGYGSTGGINGGSMQGVASGLRGPFTPSQWMELEHQALIFKYITANVPIPSYLLNPIRKAFESAGFSALRSNALGWGAFHLGFSNSDPEPGRCRRTDGKKWRCSRDAVPDQKYCERHMNRGRHRSRKPVEGQPGHSASGTTTTNGKLTPIASSTSTSVVPAGGVSDTPGLSQQPSNLQPASNNHLSGMPTVNRSLLDKENSNGAYQHTTVLSMTSPKVGPKDKQYSAHIQQNAFQESSRQEFGLVCSDSLLNPLNRSSFLINCRNYGNYGASDNLSDHDNKSQHALRQFMDDWPKTQSQHSAISWPDVDLQADRTQLSISIPVVASDFMSSTSSPTNEKLAASPPRLSQELEMGLGVGSMAVDRSQRQTNWVPISWEPSIGGPLGEVLHTTSNSTGDCKNTKPLNLIDSWDNSPRLASSPTGVLQRGAFVSLSNSSAASSPRAESSKIHDGASHCNGLISAGLMNPSLRAL